VGEHKQTVCARNRPWPAQRMPFVNCTAECHATRPTEAAPFHEINGLQISAILTTKTRTRTKMIKQLILYKTMLF